MQDDRILQFNTVGQSSEPRSIEVYNKEETQDLYQKLNPKCLPTPTQCKVKIII